MSDSGLPANDPLEQEPSLFEQTLDIETPERIHIRYELAGIGSRFAAGTIDVFILGFTLFVLFVAGLLLTECPGANS